MIATLTIAAALLAAEVDVQEVVSRHAAAHARRHAYHVSLRSHIAKDEVIGAPLAHDYDLEVWSDGARHRAQKRVFVAASASGWEDYGATGKVHDTSVDGKVLRILAGWDPLAPFALPLEFGRNAREFSTVSCSIQPWDPSLLGSRVLDESSAMLWHLRPGWPLARMAEFCEFVVIPQSNPSITRLRWAATTLPELTTPAFIQVGSVIDFAHDYDWQISRVESSFGERSLVSDVVEFKRTSDYWYPAERRSMSGADVVSIMQVLECDINQHIDDALLETAFPDGARVNEYPDLKIHIWGENEPRQTFATTASFREYIYARARELQRGDRTLIAPLEGNQTSSAFVKTNVVLLAILALCVAARWYVRRRAS